MDSLTHLAAGVLTPLAFPKTPVRAAMIGFGIAAGSLPDMDFIFGVSPEARLLLHRGITHALLWQPLLILLAVVPFYIWMHCRKPNFVDMQLGGGNTCFHRLSSAGTPAFFTMCLMALIAVLIHIYLDSFTTFGTQIFLPFSDFRAALPAMFIVDPLLTVPLLVLAAKALLQKPQIVPYRLPAAFGETASGKGVAIFSVKARRLAVAGLAWALLYPLAGLGINGIATTCLEADLAPGAKLTLLPEPFSPVLWKAVVDEGDSYRIGTISLGKAEPETVRERYSKPDQALYEALKEQLPLFSIFQGFSSFMVQQERGVSPFIQASHSRPVRELAFMDIRYILTADSPARWVGLGEPYFVLEARINDTGALLAYRFLQRGEADRDADWIELQ